MVRWGCLSENSFSFDHNNIITLETDTRSTINMLVLTWKDILENQSQKSYNFINSTSNFNDVNLRKQDLRTPMLTSDGLSQRMRVKRKTGRKGVVVRRWGSASKASNLLPSNRSSWSLTSTAVCEAIISAKADDLPHHKNQNTKEHVSRKQSNAQFIKHLTFRWACLISVEK